MGVYIKGMKMPERCGLCPCFHAEWPMYCRAVKADKNKRIVAPYGMPRPEWCPLVEIKPHGRLIDADALRAKMYHEAFETDTQMQKWDSGCWIRYKMFERMEEDAPTIIPAEEGET